MTQPRKLNALTFQTIYSDYDGIISLLFMQKKEVLTQLKIVKKLQLCALLLQVTTTI